MTFSKVLTSIWLFQLLQLFISVMSVDTSSLRPLLSPDAKIDPVPVQPLRWSEYKAPQPGAVVHPATEQDVQIMVRWAVDRNIPFLTQNGGNGWATTFRLNNTGILIQLDLLQAVNFDADGKQATIGGGSLISDLVSAAAARGSLVLTGTCNCVGALGAILGAGFSNLMGQYGLAVDDLLSLNVVKADGQAIVVTPMDTDLWWAMRGAGPNFGIVTSAILRAHPAGEKSRLSAWTGPLTFRPDQLEAVVSAIQKLRLDPKMAISLNFINTGQPSILTTLFYHGSADAGRAAFKSLYDIGPVTDSTSVLPYTNWNDGSNGPCIKSARRPTWGVGLATLDPVAWREVYNVWTELIQQAGAENSNVLCNILPTEKSRTLPDSSSAYPFRSTVRFHAGFTASYSDPAFDQVALGYGRKARSIWQATDGLAKDSTYINNAHGDEPLEAIYGNSLGRLRQLKQQHDPSRRFNEWFPLS